MPFIYCDREAADLLTAAATMMHSALSARIKVADPEKMLSNSMQLQTRKLESALAQLALPDPPLWAEMSDTHQTRILGLATILVDEKQRRSREPIINALRGLLTAVGYDDGQLAPHSAVEELQPGNKG